MSDDNGGNSNGNEGKLLHCNFCGKSQHEVRKLIAAIIVRHKNLNTLLASLLNLHPLAAIFPQHSI